MAPISWYVSVSPKLAVNCVLECVLRFPVLLFFCFAFYLVIGGVSITSSPVQGASNDTTITKVNISNSPPTLYNVSISPSPLIDLNPGTTKQVNCTALVYDVNGWGEKQKQGE